MAYDRKKLLKALQDDIDKHMYAAQGDGSDSYLDAIGEVEAWLEGHEMQHQEMLNEEEDDD